MAKNTGSFEVSRDKEHDKKADTRRELRETEGGDR